MKIWYSGTRLLQIILLAVLVVSVAQVVWWYIDQNMHTSEVRVRQLEHKALDHLRRILKTDAERRA